MSCRATIPNWCQKVEVCLELHSCSSWACFHELFDILLNIPVYFNCCFGYGVGCKSAFSIRWFNQSTDRPLPLTLWLEFYMVIIMHACIHWKCCLYFYWSGKDQQRVFAVDQELFWVWRVKQKTHRISLNEPFPCNRLWKGRAKQSPVCLQNQTWITAEYAKWDLQMFLSQFWGSLDVMYIRSW